MLPGTCHICNIRTSFFYIMIKNKDKENQEVKREVCPACKIKLEKEVWKVFGTSIH